MMEFLRRRELLRTVQATAIGLALAAASTGAEAQTYLRIGGGIGGSSWEITAGKLADMFSKAGDDVQAIAQPGNMGENLARLKRGEAELGLTYGITFRDVVTGTGAFGEHQNPKLRLLAALYPAYEQPLVPKDVPWATVRDLAADPENAAIAALTPGSATYTLANAMLEAAGSGLEKIEEEGGLVLPLNYSQGLDGMRSGQVNVIMINGPNAHPSVLEYEEQGKLLMLDDELIARITELVPGTAAATMSPDAYSFLDEPYKTFAVYTTVVISADVPDDVVYEITKYFWENIDEFRNVASYAAATDISTATVGSAELEIHPGALRYYQEVGVAD